MSVSVIIPVYNQAKYIGDAIDSILIQTKKANEIIVVNDGSTDELLDVLREYRMVITLINLERNQGVSFARNTGIKHATGDIIIFQDADDIAMPKRIAYSINVLLNKNAFIAQGMLIQFRELDLLQSNLLHSVFNDKPVHILGLGVLAVKKEVFKKIGLFNSDFKVGSDLEWLGRAIKMGFMPFKFEKASIKRRVHQSNLSNLNKQDELKIRFEILRKNLSINDMSRKKIL